MSFFRFREYLRYRRQAKGRHGVHSPFVYALVEDVLRFSTHKKLVADITAYFGIREICDCTSGSEKVQAVNAEDKAYKKTSSLSFSRLIILPANDEAIVGKYIAAMLPGDIIMITSPHENENSHAAWDRLSQTPAIKLSIDLFHSGLLFSRNEFKVKQHFRLKLSN